MIPNLNELKYTESVCNWSCLLYKKEERSDLITLFKLIKDREREGKECSPARDSERRRGHKRKLRKITLKKEANKSELPRGKYDFRARQGF